MFKENSGFKLFAKVISRRENSPTARKELNVAGLKIERSYPCLCGEDTVYVLDSTMLPGGLQRKINFLTSARNAAPIKV